MPVPAAVPVFLIPCETLKRSPGSITASPSPPTGATVVPSRAKTGVVTSTAFETTSAKSWSVPSPLFGTPSPAMFAAVTATLKAPLVPSGR